jgi:hypothetical protein
MDHEADETNTIKAADLLAASGTSSPNRIFEHYSNRGIRLRTRVLHHPEGYGVPSIEIEGDRASLIFLADLILAQAFYKLDCGVHISPTGPGNVFFEDDSKLGIYVHSLSILCPRNPCE